MADPDQLAWLRDHLDQLSEQGLALLGLTRLTGGWIVEAWEYERLPQADRLAHPTEYVQRLLVRIDTWYASGGREGFGARKRWDQMPISHCGARGGRPCAICGGAIERGERCRFRYSKRGATWAHEECARGEPL
jgi:hypothetical protein